MSNWFILVDCNNFYVSCERLFRPELQKRPVVVLSNNDGCIVARSNEIKALGIPMGEPYFRCKELLHYHQTEVFSSNYALYGDISSRVMQSLQQWFPHVEIYSIDEAFIEVKAPESTDWLAFGKAIRNRLYRWLGIPTSVGLAKTKTLAKLANKRAKKQEGVYVISSDEQRIQILKESKLTDIWGIGPRYARQLRQEGIFNAFQLTLMRDNWIRKVLTIQGLRTVHELRGTSCFALEEQPEPRRTMVHSRTFSQVIEDKETLKEVLSSYAARLSAKLRKHKLVAGYLQVFLLPKKPFEQRGNEHKRAYRHTKAITLVEASHHTPTLTRLVYDLTEEAFEAHCAYRKGGILAGALESVNSMQLSIWHDRQRNQQQDKLMGLLDRIQAKHGRKGLFFASELGNQRGRRIQDHTSPHYTTQWKDLLCVQMDKLSNSPKHWSIQPRAKKH